MNAKRESIIAINNALGHVETLVRSLGPVNEHSTKAYEIIVEARKALKIADDELKAMNRKRDGACRVQGCYDPAQQVHALDNGTDTIALCDAHSATSRLRHVGRY